MSFSACDFLEVCDTAATCYGVPEASEELLQSLDIEERGDDIDESAQQQILAERGTRALRQRARLLEACQQAEHWLMQPDRTVEPTDMLRALRAAIAEAEEGA